MGMWTLTLKYSATYTTTGERIKPVPPLATNGFPIVYASQVRGALPSPLTIRIGPYCISCISKQTTWTISIIHHTENEGIEINTLNIKIVCRYLHSTATLFIFIIHIEVCYIYFFKDLNFQFLTWIRASGRPIFSASRSRAKTSG
jgi:hypothetical protein